MNARTWFPSVARICQHTFIDSLLDARSVVVDLGANQGSFSKELIAATHCAVYAVEPVSSLFDQIPELPELKRFNLAIASANGPVPLNHSQDRCASLYRRVEGAGVSTTLVSGITFDNFLEQNDLREIDLLKIDIEGAECALFSNFAQNRYPDVGQITVEFHDFMYPELHASVGAIKRQIVSHGFYCIPFSLDNTDILFVNQRKIPYTAYVFLRLWTRNWKGMQRMAARHVRISHP
jgi:FkbM family methyltransferase